MIEAVFEPNFSAWREKARSLVQAGTLPGAVHWTPSSGAQSLLLGIEESATDRVTPGKALFKVPKEFMSIAESVSFHRDERKWDLLYRILFRLCHEQPKLLDISVDPDVLRLHVLEKAVRRDAHKMKAFVRFRKTPEPNSRYVAWYRSDHPIVRWVAPFFARRFAAMNWSILTPDESVHWEHNTLLYTPGVPGSEAPHEDGLDDLWRKYYIAIFNPARIKIGAMTKEMPKRFWENLPESRVIAELLRERETRTETMLAARPASASDFLPNGDALSDLSALEKASQACRGCPIGESATQAVFGEGPKTARIALVGEQPGDQEDLQGKPFVGPAGQLLDQALKAAGLKREELYLTNAVKHFKWRPLGKRRLHAKPRAGEVAACQPWLAREMDIVKPEFLICLGATAALSVMGRLVKINQERGEFSNTPYSPNTLITFHPSAILRAGDDTAQAAQFAQLVEDLKKVAEAAGRHHSKAASPQTLISAPDGL